MAEPHNLNEEPLASPSSSDILDSTPNPDATSGISSHATVDPVSESSQTENESASHATPDSASGAEPESEHTPKTSSEISSQEATAKKAGIKHIKSAHKKQQGNHYGEPSAESHHTDAASPSHYSEQSSTQKKSSALKILAACIGTLVLVYAIGGLYFSTHFFPHTTLFEYDISLMSSWAARSDFEEILATYEAEVTGIGLNFTISGEAVGLSLDTQALIDEALSCQNAWVWPLELLFDHDLVTETQATISEEALSECVAEQVDPLNQNSSLPTNARVAYDQSQHSFIVTSEIYGTRIDADLTCATLSEELASLPTKITLNRACLVQPTLRKDNEQLAQAAAQANALIDFEIPVILGDEAVVTLDSDTFQSFVTISDSYEVSLDDDAFVDWCENDFVPAFNTLKSERTYTRPDGKQITVSGGTYGWEIDEEATQEALCEAFLARASQSVIVTVTQEAQIWTGAGAQDWGLTYVDVDLEEQHAYYYQDGELLWDSDIVSGAVGTGHGTPTGVYTLRAKARNVTLVGLDEDDDEEPDYETPVSYWMPFLGNSVGLHDADWRSTFGGSTYYWSGSHGCVNLPVDSAATLYGIIEIGTVVVVHY